MRSFLLILIFLTLSMQSKAKVFDHQEVPQSDAPSVAAKPDPGFGAPQYAGDPVSLDLVNQPLSEVLRFFADRYKTNFVFDKSVEKTIVTIQCQRTPWNEAVEAMLRANGLGFRRERSFVRIASIAALTAEAEDLRKQRQAEVLNQERRTVFFKLRYAQVGGERQVGQNAAQNRTAATEAAGGAGGAIPQPAGTGSGLVAIVTQNLSPVGTVAVDPRTNTLIVTDGEKQIARIQQILDTLDAPEPQIQIEARIVVANRNFTRDLGALLNAGFTSGRGTAAQFGTGAGATNGNFIGPAINNALSGAPASVLNFFNPVGTARIAAALTAQEERGVVQTLSAPHVIVQNNQTAEVLRGSLIPFTSAQGLGATAVTTTTFQNANLGLTVTPRVASDQEILLELAVNNDSIDRSIAINGQPPISKQSVSTRVLCPNGGAVMLSGVISDDQLQRLIQTPGLSKIPGLGNFFKRQVKNRSQSELLFFVTARIVPVQRPVEIINRPPSLVIPNPIDSGAPPPPLEGGREAGGSFQTFLPPQKSAQEKKATNSPVVLVNGDTLKIKSGNGDVQKKEPEFKKDDSAPHLASPVVPQPPVPQASLRRRPTGNGRLTVSSSERQSNSSFSRLSGRGKTPRWIVNVKRHARRRPTGNGRLTVSSSERQSNSAFLRPSGRGKTPRWIVNVKPHARWTVQFAVFRRRPAPPVSWKFLRSSRLV
jgi:type IV pilus assembly protein PilQ